MFAEESGPIPSLILSSVFHIMGHITCYCRFVVSQIFIYLLFILNEYLYGAAEEGEEVSADWQQDEHAVEVQAGSRSSGPGQSLLWRV